MPLLSLPPISTAEFLASLTDWLQRWGDDLLFVADSEWDQKILAKTFAALGQPLPANWRFQKTPDNFTNGQQRCLFNDELGAYFLRDPDQQRHHALTDARAIREAYLRAELGL